MHQPTAMIVIVNFEGLVQLVPFTAKFIFLQETRFVGTIFFGEDIPVTLATAASLPA
jgi:hypothetical protein